MNRLKCTKCNKFIDNPTIVYGVLTCPHCKAQYDNFRIEPAGPFGVSAVDPCNTSYPCIHIEEGKNK